MVRVVILEKLARWTNWISCYW